MRNVPFDHLFNMFNIINGQLAINGEFLVQIPQRLLTPPLLNLYTAELKTKYVKSRFFRSAFAQTCERSGDILSVHARLRVGTIITVFELKL